MDTTKQNILMCEKAEKIQENWDFTSEFNLLYDKVLKKPFLNVTLYVQGIKKNKERYIWLPRQGQLQKMIDWPGSILIGHIPNNKLMLSYVYQGIRSKVKGNSMEQLWLAFVMKEKYQKVWNGKDWEAE